MALFMIGIFILIGIFALNGSEGLGQMVGALVLSAIVILGVCLLGTFIQMVQ
jgi:hypothetical protein